jgi:hypothetical protein
MEEISWTDLLKNEVLQRVKGAEEYPTYSKKEEG